MQSLQEYCRACSYEGSIGELAERIHVIQSSIFNLVWERSEKTSLTTEEIRAITHDYLAQNHGNVNDVGEMAIFQWVIWMAWHEGCVAYDTADR